MMKFAPILVVFLKEVYKGHDPWYWFCNETDYFSVPSDTSSLWWNWWLIERSMCHFCRDLIKVIILLVAWMTTRQRIQSRFSLTSTFFSSLIDFSSVILVRIGSTFAALLDCQNAISKCVWKDCNLHVLALITIYGVQYEFIRTHWSANRQFDTSNSY